MSRGNVYIWIPDSTNPLGGGVVRRVVRLPRLEPDNEGRAQLSGRYVRVQNAGEINLPSGEAGKVRPVAIGNAAPNADGDFVFRTRRGGGRIDKVALVEPLCRERYIEASRFGEVNSYYHLDCIAVYVDRLLREIGAPSLPRVTAVVNAHHAATERGGIRDGVLRSGRWLPFQGGHYRLPSRREEVAEHAPISADGEIHLGPGWRLFENGALAEGLVEAAGRPYRANASHNAGILYHEYGHHITRHTADFRANALRRPRRQDNRKTALDEGTCDYWAATMLGVPHIWSWHQRHDAEEVHPRSLLSAKAMGDFDDRRGADAHANGTIWGAGLWDLRTELAARDTGGARRMDLMLLQALILLGRLFDDEQHPTVVGTRRVRDGFSTGLAALLEADERLFAARHRRMIMSTFSRRGIVPARTTGGPYVIRKATVDDHVSESGSAQLPGVVIRGLLKHVSPSEIPAPSDLRSGEALEAYLHSLAEPPLSLIAVGDIMLSGRARRTIRKHGADYLFDATRPLLRRAPIVLGNLEGPMARVAKREARNHSYRTNPTLAWPLARAGFNVVTLANNHLLDCGRAGVLETLDTLATSGIAPIGAGASKKAAHAACILPAGPYRVGFLGYYWNRRTAATATLPGSAMDSPQALANDIGNLRPRVDRIVVTFHWGVPYEHEPSADDRAKARYAVDCGADVVIGHHPHVVQPFEVYRGSPIFYSIGNFAFGSGNSRAESLLIGIRFEDSETSVYVYPLYVKNRDPRADYQPKVLRGKGAEWVLHRLAGRSASSGQLLTIEPDRGRLHLVRDGPSIVRAGSSTVTDDG